MPTVPEKTSADEKSPFQSREHVVRMDVFEAFMLSPC